MCLRNESACNRPFACSGICRKATYVNQSALSFFLLLPHTQQKCFDSRTCFVIRIWLHDSVFSVHYMRNLSLPYYGIMSLIQLLPSLVSSSRCRRQISISQCQAKEARLSAYEQQQLIHRVHVLHFTASLTASQGHVKYLVHASGANFVISQIMYLRLGHRQQQQRQQELEKESMVSFNLGSLESSFHEFDPVFPG